MSEYLVIRLAEQAAAGAEWIAVDSSGARLGAPASGTLDEAAAAVGERGVIVLLPSAEVLTTSVDIPVKGQRLLAALPFALEEYLAEDVEDLHFAAGAKRDSGRTPVSVASKAAMAEWMQRLAGAGIDAKSLIAESYGLPRIPRTISLLLAEDTVYVNDGDDIELVLPGVGPGDALAAIGALDDGTAGDTSDDDDEAAASGMPRHVLVYCSPEDDERYQHDWIAIRHELESLDVKVLPDGVLPRLAVTVATGTGVNLLQGEYAPRREYSGLLRPWRRAAVLALAFGIVGLGVKGADFYLLSRQEAELQATFNAEYQALLPGAPAAAAPGPVIESLRRRVGVVEADPVFLLTMEQLGNAVRANRAAKIQAISFRAGVTDLRIQAPDVATLDGLQRAIGESGRFRAAIQSTDQEDQGVSSRIQVSETGS